MEEKAGEKSSEENCKAYEIGCSKESGKFLIAKRNIEPGDIILVDNPILISPKCGRDDVLCVGCCSIVEDKNQCFECGWPICSTDCKDLAVCHSDECQILKLCPTKFGDSYFRYDILMVLRCLLLQTTKKDKWGVLISWDDNLENQIIKNDFLKRIQEKCTFIEEVYTKPLKIHEKNIGKVLLPKASKEIIQKICGILDTNIMECNNHHVLYHTASLFEHNCVANSTQVIEHKNGFRITVRAVTPISKGDHITLSYINTLWGTPERLYHLKNLKHVSCACSRCTDATELDTFLSAMICFGVEEDPCKGVQLSLNPTDDNSKWICNKCDIKLPNKEVFKFVKHLSKEVDKELKKNPPFEELKDFLEKLKLFLHQNHYLVNRVKHHLIQLQQTECISEKLNWCQDLIEVVKKIDPYRARLGLYLSAVLNEQFNGKMDLLIKRFSPTQEEASFSLIKELFNILKENEEILLFQCKYNDEEINLKINSDNESRLRNWLLENSISFVAD